MFCWLDGKLIESADGRIALDDRNFRYGDGLFETILLRGGVPYLWQHHFDRLTLGATALGLSFDGEKLASAVSQLVEINRLNDGILRIALGRGSGGRGYRLPAAAKPLLLIECFPLPLPDHSPLRVLISDYRTIPPACLPNGCKTAQGLNAILALRQANEAGGEEALQLSITGSPASFASGNLFWKTGDRWFTPALSTGCLAGVTRRRLIELFPDIEEGETTLAELRIAEAIVLTNSIVLCRAVAMLGANFYPQSEQLAANWRAALIADSENASLSMNQA